MAPILPFTFLYIIPMGVICCLGFTVSTPTDTWSSKCQPGPAGPNPKKLLSLTPQDVPCHSAIHCCAPTVPVSQDNHARSSTQ